MSITTKTVSSNSIGIATTQSNLKPKDGEAEIKSKKDAKLTSEIAWKANSLAAVLFSEKFVQKLANNKEAFIKLGVLVIKVTQEAIEVLFTGDGQKVDPLVSDRGCELYAMKNLSIFISQEVRTEAANLKKKTLEILEQLKRKDANGFNIFAKEIATISVSADMGYLIRSRLLTITKDAFGNEDNEITNCNRLNTVVKGVPCRSTIVAEAQAALSRDSFEHIKSEVAKITSLTAKPMEMMRKVLEQYKEKEILLDPSEKRIVLIGCQYYKTKAVLIRLKEMQTIIGIRKKYNKGRKNESFLLLYKSAIAEGPLLRIPDEEAKKLAKSEPMIVFDGDVRAGIDREELAKIIKANTLEKLILTSDAVVSQYGCISKMPTTIDDIPVIEARDEVRLYEKYWKEINCVPNQSPVFNLDHVLFDTIGNEMLS